MRLAGVSHAAPAAATQPAAPPRMNANDRLTIMMNLFRPIATLAAQRDDLTRLVTTAVSALHRRIRGCEATVTPIENVPATAESGLEDPVVAQAAVAEMAPHLSASNPQVKSRKGKSAKRAMPASGPTSRGGHAGGRGRGRGSGI